MTTVNRERTLIFLFELGQIAAYKRFIKERPDIHEEEHIVVALDPEIESALATKGMPYISAEAYRTHDAEPRIYARDYSQLLFDSDRWKFFSYRGISLTRTYSFSLQVYLTELLYQTDIIANVLARHPYAKRCVAFPSLTAAPIMGSCWMGYWITIPVDAIKLLAEQSGRDAIIPYVDKPTPERTQRFLFTLKRKIFGMGIAVLNMVVPLLHRRGKVRILISDYWSNAAQMLGQLDSAEAIFIDRMAALNAGISQIWRYRMRFTHLDAYASKRSRERKLTSDSILKEWSALKERTDIPQCFFRGYTLEALVMPVLATIIEEGAGKTLVSIDGAFEMLERLRPDVVMLRATTSAQPHFSILAQVSRLLGIPSIEMLHGLDYYGPGSSYRFHEAEYVGIYGRLIEQQMSHLGPKNTKLVIIGSPRFDVYAQLLKEQQPQQISKDNVVFLCIAPVAGAGDIDMYDIVEYFGAIADALRTVPNASVVIKFRPGNNRDEFVRSVLARQFADIPYSIAQAEPLWNVFPRADVVISCFSTAALEALQCGKPLVYLGLSPSQQMLGLSHFSSYAEQGAIRLIIDKQTLGPVLNDLAASPEAREELSQKAALFLNKEFAFDGHANERTVELITFLAKGKKA